ncbi:hypothetical protein ABB37_05906 [Leptomonas pyrrhocoris]|uniref:Protein kinase domain-containing protein n=1 Tax=Leptomonas pyrrhocoris TaxID=157538 RepID=A0A0N0DUE8_LEPPY|nr:hypothetical protein ABB37_05906 [Leptomonas pyrrhocoris]KPA78814.1 hypothetical protein ABB37_05906 [Leptomonas pyrrhocoris]|eukprot:XP_015657253.1 hypothetical protein ABB37_05906 [Leptomonas pyrrhocoris]
MQDAHRSSEEMGVEMQLNNCGAPPRAPPIAKRPGGHRSTRPSAVDFVCRIDVCWTFFFFVFLVCVAATTTAITETTILKSLLTDLHNVHSVRITTVKKEMDLLTDRPFSMAAGFLSLHSQKAFELRSEKTLAKLCSILAAFDRNTDFRSLAVTSLALKEAISCMHGDEKLSSKYQLYGWVTNNSVIPGVYLINRSTYEFYRPLQAVYGGWPTSVYNLSETFDTLLADNPAFTEAAAYFNGSIEYVDYRTFWRSFDTIPHIIYCNIPVSFLFRGLHLPFKINVTDYVDVRVDGSTLLATSNTTSTTQVTAAIFINATLTDDDPQVMSDTWGQASVNDTEMLTTYEENQMSYLKVSNISDPLMRAALTHVNLAALQQEGHSQTKDFQYRGAPAVITATAYTTKRGLVLPMVLVSSHAAIALPYHRIMNICNSVTAAVILIITGLFFVFINRHLRDPLQRISNLLLLSVERGSRALFQSHHHGCVTLSEVQQLGAAHNGAMRQLREIDAFIPVAARQEVMLGRSRGVSLSTLSSSNSQGSHPLRTSGRTHAELLLTHLSTVVYISIRPLPVPRGLSSGATLQGDADVPPKQQRLAAVVTRVAHTVKRTNAGPFPTPASLGVFAEKVYELCELHHGTVHRLCPDGCIIHFNKAVRRHLAVAFDAPRKSASTSTPELPAVSPRRGRALERDESLLPKTDAQDAMAFALALQAWVDASAACSVLDVRFLADTSIFTCGHYRAHDCDTTLSVALGRDVQREVGHVPASIGVRIAMTEETASRVRAKAKNDTVGETEPSVRQLPVEALRIGRVGQDEDVVVLYEALPGPALDDEAWRLYQRHCFDGFSHMVHGDYAAALQAYKRVADISDLEPGLMPASLRREAARSDVTGGAVSVQAERLIGECERRLRAGLTEGFHRERHVPLGIDSVLKGIERRSSSSPSHDTAVRRVCPGERESAVAKREGRYGVEEHNATFTRAELRYVAVLPGTETRTSYTRWPATITDNWGTKWTVARKHAVGPGRAMHSILGSGLSATGDLCALVFRLHRDVPPLVSTALRGAPAGVMTDAMRSAVPVWQPSAAQRAAVRALFDARLRLRHPHIVTCLGYSMELEGGVTISMEYCKGGNLREVMVRYDRMRPPTMIRAALSMLLGLRYLHANGIVHGELRPECVLVCSDGVCRLKGFYTDYELAHRALGLRRTCYVCPEMAAGQSPTPASDVFGFGLVMLELVIRKLPWTWATVTGDGPQRSEEELAALAAADVQAFSDAVAQGKVIPALEMLATPEIVVGYHADGLDTIRACLRIDPLRRISLEDLIRALEKIAVANGVIAMPLHNHTSSNDSS